MSFLAPTAGCRNEPVITESSVRTPSTGDVEMQLIADRALVGDSLSLGRDAGQRVAATDAHDARGARARASTMSARRAFAFLACACAGGGLLGGAVTAAIRPIVQRRLAAAHANGGEHAPQLPPALRVHSADGAFAGDANAIAAIEAAHAVLDASPSMRALRASLRAGSSPVYIRLEKNQAFEHTFEDGSEIVWDPRAALMQHAANASTPAGDCMTRPPILALPHEETHADWKLHNPLGQDLLRALYHPYYDNLEEARAVTATNAISQELGFRERRGHAVAFKPAHDMFDDGDGTCPPGALPPIDEALAAEFRGKANPDLQRLHACANEEQVLYANFLAQGIRLEHGLRREIAERFNANRLLLIDVAAHIAAGGAIAPFEERLHTHMQESVATAARLHGIGKPLIPPNYLPH